jgi:hypothetical protein
MLHPICMIGHQLNQRFNNATKSFNKLLVIVTQAQKWSQLINIQWLGILWNGFNIGLLNPIHMDKSYDMGIPSDVKKSTLTRMQIKVVFFKFIKHLVQMLHAIPLT